MIRRQMQSRRLRQRPGTIIDDARRQLPLLPVDVTTPLAKLVYVYLWMMEPADVADISRATHVPQIRLYPVLETLASRGHVERRGSTFTLYQAA